MSRFRCFGGLGAMLSLAVALGTGATAVGCSGDSMGADGSLDGSESVDGAAISNDDTTTDGGSDELGTSQQALSFSSPSGFSSPFGFKSSCSDPNGTNSVMAALAVATATELKRWQPTKDFVSSGGQLRLTWTGMSQCEDGKCWNTQALLDLQSAPPGKVKIRPGVTLDSKGLKSALAKNLVEQIVSQFKKPLPAHEFELLYSEAGGCDQYYWFNVKSPTGGTVTSELVKSLEKNLTWVGGKSNPYIKFQTNGTMVGIDPTYGLNEDGSTTAGSCAAACTKMSSTDIRGSCCSCNGTKKFARSAWSTTTYICQ